MNRVHRITVLALVSALAIAGEVDVLPRPLLIQDEAVRAEVRRVHGSVMSVKVAGVEIIMAANLADGVNVAAGRDPGCSRIDHPGGPGFVAVGEATYAVMENPTATRISRRNAGLKALAQARADLTTTVLGLDIATAEDVHVALTGAALPKEPAARQARIVRSLESLLQGYAVYDLDDLPERQRIRVILVATVGTRSERQRLGPACLEVADLDEAIAEMTALANRGLIPPVGGRLLIAADDRTVALVGFGACVVRQHADKDLAVKLAAEAREVARARAQRGLLALLQDEGVDWNADLDEVDQEAQAIAALNEPGDPTAIAALARRREAFLAILKTQQEWTVIAAGTIPPGVELVTFLSPDGGVACAVAVSRPQPAFPSPEDVPPEAPPVPVAEADAGQRPDQQVERGPTGQVTEEDDL